MDTGFDLVTKKSVLHKSSLVLIIRKDFYYIKGKRSSTSLGMLNSWFVKYKNYILRNLSTGERRYDILMTEIKEDLLLCNA